MRVLVAAGLSVMLAGSALAQGAPDAAMASAKAAFEALPLAERRAIQRDLVWVGGFAGASSGDFGPLTFAALKRFETSERLKIDGQLTGTEREVLAKAAQAARAASGFAVQSDKLSGMKIGVPTKLLTKRSVASSGHDRWQDAGDRITFDFTTGKPEDTLESLFEKGTDTRAAGRKITYKLLRPDFFVISGETTSGKFYRRLEKGADGKLRGFALGYDKSVAATLDPLVIAMASTFEAVPGAGGASAPPAAAQQAGVPVQAALQPRPAKKPRLTGLVIAPGKVITAASASTCKSLTPEPARGAVSVEKTDAAAGLALLGITGLNAAPLKLASDAPKEGVLLQRDLDGKLVAAPAQVEGALLLAPVQEGGAGAGVLDARGEVIALVVAEPAVKYAFNGTLPALRYPLASAAQIVAFAGVSVAPASGAPTRSAGEIASAAGGGIVSLICER